MLNPPPNPFLVLPDKLEHPPMNNLICFLDKDRGCGPDCMGYTINTPGDHYNEPWCHCTVLMSMFRISKHVVILAQHGAESLEMMRTTEADTVRAGNAPAVPPFIPPTGKKVDP